MIATIDDRNPDFTKRRSDEATKRRSDEATKRRSDEATKRRSDEATKRRSDEQVTPEDSENSPSASRTDTSVRAGRRFAPARRRPLRMPRAP
ncbi:hypothetical protein WS86_28795 [Burkholderia savannae]|nr:hypothetical protein WS86_28795 [Burkholderia savannae]